MKISSFLQRRVLSPAMQAVIVRVPQVDFEQMTALEDELISVLEPSSIGEHDGNEIGDSETTLWMYGPDAEKLFRFVEPTLRSYAFLQKADITLRFGDPGSEALTFALHAEGEAVTA